MPRKVLPFFAGAALLAIAGCQHDYDGTVLIPQPLDYRLLWQKTPTRAEAPRRGGNLFPAAPSRSRYTAEGAGADVPKKHLTRKPPVQAISSDGPSSPLTCRNVSEPGKRVHVVCE